MEVGESARLARVLGQGEDVQDKVEHAASDLSTVNAVLGVHVGHHRPLRAVVDALDKSAEVEVMVQEASQELAAMNDELSAEIDDRLLVEGELARIQAELELSRIKERRSRHDALHDRLTGLPNASLFTDRLEHAISQSNRHNWQAAVMFIDLDGFKSVNDTHGHAVGDGVLQMVAERLTAFVRAGDTVSRRSGDEFLFLMLEAKGRDSARAMAGRIIAELARPCTVEGVELTVASTIGFAMFPEDGTEPDALLRRADLDMYAHKPVAPRGSAPVILNA